MQKGKNYMSENNPVYSIYLNNLSSMMAVNEDNMLILFLFKGQRKSINKDELKPTTQALERVQSLCAENKSSSELISDINTLFLNIK